MSFARRSASVEFRSVSRHYGKVVAVNSVSFTIPTGTLATLLGPSGCGKTTTLRMIAGLEVPTSGQILIGGEDVTNLPPMQRDVSMVFQSYALFPHMTVLENVAYGLAGTAETKAQQADRARQGLDLVGLSGFERRMPSELSGGQQQRVAVARALVLEPRVLLFDEPLSNLDAKLRRRMREEIRDLQQSLGLTSVYVTHDQEEALAVSDQIIVMDQACIAQIGTPEDLYRQPASAFVADFIGGANLLPCDVTDIADGVATVQLGPVRVQVQAPTSATRGSAKLVVRPGAVALLAGGAPAPGAALPAEVRKATYLGSHWEYTLVTDLGEVFVTQTAEAGHPPGTSVQMTLERRGLALVSA